MEYPSLVDQIFDRLGRLINSFFIQGEEDDDEFRHAEGGSHTGDADFDSAMDELDEYLRDDMTEREKKEREAARRAAAEEAARRARARQGSQAAGPSGPPIGLVRDYALLGVTFGARMEVLKPAYKRILKEHHPDKHAGHPEEIAKATDYCARVNAAYQRIETWLETGRYE